MPTIAKTENFLRIAHLYYVFTSCLQLNICYLKENVREFTNKCFTIFFAPKFEPLQEKNMRMTQVSEILFPSFLWKLLMYLFRIMTFLIKSLYYQTAFCRPLCKARSNGTVNQCMFTEVEVANQWHCRAHCNLCPTLHKKHVLFDYDQAWEQLTQK